MQLLIRCRCSAEFLAAVLTQVPTVFCRRSLSANSDSLKNVHARGRRGARTSKAVEPKAWSTEEQLRLLRSPIQG